MHDELKIATPATRAPRELTAAEMQQVGGGLAEPEWRYVPVRRFS